MNIFLILMVSISMTGYQYYNKIKSYIAGREEFSSVEENQLKYSLGCLKDFHLNNVNFHNASQGKLPINTVINYPKTCGINQDKIFSFKFCVAPGTKAVVKAGGSEKGESGENLGNSVGCFTDDNTMQYVVSVLDTDVSSNQYSLILSEDVSFTSASGNLTGPASAKTIPSDILKSLPANIKIPNNRALIIYSATTAETKLAIKKNLTEGKLTEYGKNENPLCSNFKDYNNDPILKNQCISKRGWVYSPQSCTWMCPQLTIDEITQWKEFQDCKRNGGLLVVKELTHEGKKFACVADYKELMSSNVCNGKNGFIEIMEKGEGKEKQFIAACMEKKKSESGCSICQVPVAEFGTGKWLCSFPRKKDSNPDFVQNNPKTSVTEIVKFWDSDGNKDVKYIKDAGCLDGCRGLINDRYIRWEPEQRLFKCTGCPSGQQMQYDESGDGQCVSPKCTGNLMYVAEIDKCVAIKWCKINENLNLKGIFRGDLKGDCPGPKSNMELKKSLGNDKKEINIKVTTLFRKTYNPLHKCFYCRIVTPEPINVNTGSNGYGIYDINILHKVFDGIKNFVSNIDFVSDAYADDSKIKDAIDEESYTIDANMYPPYIGDENVDNIQAYLQIPFKTPEKETDLSYCATDVNSYRLKHYKTGPIQSNTDLCINCVGDGSCKRSKGVFVKGYVSNTGNDETSAFGKEIALYMRDTDRKDGFSIGLGSNDTDIIKYVSMWEGSQGCFMECNYKDENCEVRQGFRRFYQSRGASYYQEALCKRYLENFPDITQGGWSGAIRDFDIDQKAYGLKFQHFTYQYPNPSIVQKSNKTQLPIVEGILKKCSEPNGLCMQLPSLNYCSLYIGGDEIKGVTTLTKYLYNPDSGQTLCWPRLAMDKPSDVGKSGYKPDVYAVTGNSDSDVKACETQDRFGPNTCIGQVVRNNNGEAMDLKHIIKNNGELADYTTVLSDISFRNKIDCSYEKGYCTVSPGIPEPCGRGEDTMYHEIITFLGSKGILDSNTAISQFKNNQRPDCAAGYRRAVTWKFKNVTFKDGVSLSTKVLVKNCSFCEKVLFTSATIGNSNPLKDNGTINGIDGITESEAVTNYYLGKWEYAGNNIKLISNDPLQLGGAGVAVFRVNPNMTLSDYKDLYNNRNSNQFSYVDPFNAFRNENLKVRKFGSSEVREYGLIDHDTMRKARNGDNTTLSNNMSQRRNIVNFYECGDRKGGICNRDKPGVCPNGMIAVKETDNNISCQAYISNPHRAGCYTPARSGYYNSQFNNENSISSGSNTANNQRSVEHAYGRLGCLNGYTMVYKENKLKCVKGIGSNVKRCKNEGSIKYQLIPVFKNGKLSFECIRKGYTQPDCEYSVSNGSIGLTGSACAPGSINIIPLGNGGANHNANKKNDAIRNLCSYYKIQSNTDDYNRILNINRASGMFIANDCFTCL